MDKKYKTSIVLSGGGARGFAHLGILQALNENDIFPEAFSGASAGSLAAAYYSAGYQPTEILKMLSFKNYYKFFHLSLPDQGFVKNVALYKIMTEHLPLTFEELKIPTHIAISDLNNGTVNYVSNGPLLKVIMASTAIPIIYKPIIINNIHYVDGGLLNNLPIEPLIDDSEFIIGCHTNPTNKFDNFKNIFHIAERCFYLSIQENIKPKLKHLSLFIEPKELSKYSIFDFKKAEEIFEVGYKHCIKILENDKDLVNKLKNKK